MIEATEFEEQCRDLNLREIEQNIARWIRRFEVPTLKTRRGVENTLLRLSLDCATLNPNSLFAPDGVEDYSTVSFARAMGNLAQPRKVSAVTYYLLAAVSYAVAGNFASASVWAKKALPKCSVVNSFEYWVANTLASCIQQTNAHAPRALQQYASALDTALSTGDTNEFDRATREFNAVCGKPSAKWSDFDRFLLLFWRTIHNRCWQLSAARVLLASKIKDARYIDAFKRKTSALLFPSQVNVLEEKGLLRNTGNALILLPTSTGKTLLGELAIINALSDERPIAAYLAPYRALADQVARRMKPRLEAMGIHCEVRRGGYLEEGTLKRQNSRRVIVATPEAFDALMREQPSLYTQIACCVLDEFHLIEQPGRGLIYEGIVARLMSTGEGNAPKIVALSPVLSRSDELCSWLNITKDRVFSSAWRPTARRIAIATPDGSVSYFNPGERSFPSASASSSVTWQGYTEFPYNINTIASPPNYGLMKIQRKQVLENVASVAFDQYGRFKEPILVVCMSRAQTRAIAHLVAAKLDELDSDSPASMLSIEILQRSPYLQTLARSLCRGVAYHNASLPGWLREKLESLMERKLLKIVMATTTLAEGIDLPFRTVVMAGWHQWRFGKRQPLPSLLFRNIAGRCGRAGVYVEGDTVIVDNPEQTGSNIRDRQRSYLDLYVHPQEITLQSSLSMESSIAADDDNEKTSLSRETSAALESQFTAFVDVSNGQENQEELFVSSIFAGRDIKIKSALVGSLRRFSEEMVGANDYPLMQMNSPLSLTPFGRVALATGLSGRSCLNLIRFLQSYIPEDEPRKGGKGRRQHGVQWDPLVFALTQKTLVGDFVLELESGEFEQIKNTRTYPVKEKYFADIVLAWISGVSLPGMAQMLTTSKSRRQEVESWQREAGTEMPDFMEEDVEQLAVFCGSYLAQRWSWVLRALSNIAAAIDRSDIQDEAKKIARRLEFGSLFIETADLLSAGCPADRTLVDALIGAFFAENDRTFVRGEFKQWLLESTARETAQTLPGAGTDDGWTQSLDALLNFL